MFLGEDPIARILNSHNVHSEQLSNIIEKFLGEDHVFSVGMEINHNFGGACRERKVEARDVVVNPSLIILPKELLRVLYFCLLVVSDRLFNLEVPLLLFFLQLLEPLLVHLGVSQRSIASLCGGEGLDGLSYWPFLLNLTQVQLACF